MVNEEVYINSIKIQAKTLSQYTKKISGQMGTANVTILNHDGSFTDQFSVTDLIFKKLEIYLEGTLRWAGHIINLPKEISSRKATLHVQAVDGSYQFARKIVETFQTNLDVDKHVHAAAETHDLEIGEAYKEFHGLVNTKGTDYITDTNKSWTVNQWTDYQLQIVKNKFVRAESVTCDDEADAYIWADGTVSDTWSWEDGGKYWVKIDYRMLWGAGPPGVYPYVTLKFYLRGYTASTDIESFKIHLGYKNCYSGYAAGAVQVYNYSGAGSWENLETSISEGAHSVSYTETAAGVVLTGDSNYIDTGNNNEVKIRINGGWELWNLILFTEAWIGETEIYHAAIEVKAKALPTLQFNIDSNTATQVNVEVAFDPDDINQGDYYMFISRSDDVIKKLLATYDSWQLINTTDSGETISEDLDISEAGVDVSDGTQFVANDIIRVNDELMKVTNVVGNTLTVTRGYYSPATTHSNGDTIYDYDDTTCDTGEKYLGFEWKHVTASKIIYDILKLEEAEFFIDENFKAHFKLAKDITSSFSLNAGLNSNNNVQLIKPAFNGSQVVTKARVVWNGGYEDVESNPNSYPDNEVIYQVQEIINSETAKQMADSMINMAKTDTEPIVITGQIMAFIDHNPLTGVTLTVPEHGIDNTLYVISETSYINDGFTWKTSATLTKASSRARGYPKQLEFLGEIYGRIQQLENKVSRKIDQPHYLRAHNHEDEIHGGDILSPKTIRIGDGTDGIFIQVASNVVECQLKDNMANALDFIQNTNSYLKFITTNAAEKCLFGKVPQYAADPTNNDDLTRRSYVTGKITTDIATHAAIAAAHHVKYTDAEVKAIIDAVERPVPCPIMHGSGTWEASGYYTVNASGEYFWINFLVTDAMDPASDIKIKLVTQCTSADATVAFAIWLFAGQADGSEAHSWNVENNTVWNFDSTTANRYYTQTYTLANADFTTGDHVWFKIKLNEAARTVNVFNAQIVYTVAS